MKADDEPGLQGGKESTFQREMGKSKGKAIIFQTEGKQSSRQARPTAMKHKSL